jgi:uncharacterized protein YdhG (YjbR/CyaY superfamily)
MDTPKAQFTTIDEYIDSCPEDMRPVLQTLRQTIKKAAPEAGEAIKYGMPTFTLHGNLVGFALWKTHIGLYPAGYTTALEAAFEELSAYKSSGKGTLQFPIDRPLPLDLIRRIVEFRVSEVAQKQTNKVKSKKKS